ncbi:CDP-diacylglycerol--glycerol-3-phosphate 3-phosphatidyltransferase [Corynebacterium durum]
MLTSLRIIVIPVFAWLVLKGNNHHIGWMWWSFGTFVALMITDKLDGDIARARGLITNFGKIADPIADKALMTTALVCLNYVGALPWWVTIVICIREFGITLWRMVQLRRGRVVPASRGGKIKTTLQAVAVAFYLVPLPDWMNVPKYAVMGAAVLVTVVTGLQYLLDSRNTNASHV